SLGSVPLASPWGLSPWLLLGVCPPGFSLGSVPLASPWGLSPLASPWGLCNPAEPRPEVSRLLRSFDLALRPETWNRRP
ncbi:MAG: hypothetical protein LBU18_07540, partial [Treponema sp.]|nr:hypothetical protein [Treponema sp.]